MVIKATKVYRPVFRLSRVVKLALSRLCCSFNNTAFIENTGTVKILKFGTPLTIAIIVLKIEKFDVTLHQCIQKMLMEWQTA